MLIQDAMSMDKELQVLVYIGHNCCCMKFSCSRTSSSTTTTMPMMKLIRSFRSCKMNFQSLSQSHNPSGLNLIEFNECYNSNYSSLHDLAASNVMNITTGYWCTNKANDELLAFVKFA